MELTLAKVLATLCLACGVLPAIAQMSSIDAYERLQSVPQGPIQLGYARGMSWAEYCPDETCDVIRTRRQINETMLARLALAYFYYASNYSYLRSWKEDESLKRQVDAFLDSQDGSRCSASAGRARSICILRSLADAYHLEILLIRHDEHKTSVQRMTRGETIK
jgi:hypothetical protein